MNFLHNSVEVGGGGGGAEFRVQGDLLGLSISTSSAQVRDFISFDRFYIFVKLLLKNSQLISK
jgi:hypothetical protein